jgi:hypothetical protein
VQPDTEDRAGRERFDRHAVLGDLARCSRLDRPDNRLPGGIAHDDGGYDCERHRANSIDAPLVSHCCPSLEKIAAAALGAPCPLRDRAPKFAPSILDHLGRESPSKEFQTTFPRVDDAA